MRWFRSRRFEVVLLAFFALACQFVLSFGHVHFNRFAGNVTNWTIAAGAGKAIAAPAGEITHAGLPASPRQNGPVGLGDDFCAVCASISLASALLVPIASTPVSRNVSFEELQWSFAATRARSIDHVHFNARGPPTA
jgi:hypothetical protein